LTELDVSASVEGTIDVRKSVVVSTDVNSIVVRIFNVVIEVFVVKSFDVLSIDVVGKFVVVKNIEVKEPEVDTNDDGLVVTDVDS
jgi:hypothetical protein